jgi:hypothetical protein
MNNFYNEPAPMRELANLGTSIPSPALPLCMTAALCVKLGNQYNHAWNAEAAADDVLDSISKERWLYYLEDRLERDLVILPKLATPGKPLNRWISLVCAKGLDTDDLVGKESRELLKATYANQSTKVAEIASSMLRSAT